jgi:hypothetical protein
MYGREAGWVQLSIGALVAVLAVALWWCASAGANAITAENTLPGDASWSLAQPAGTVQAYTSQVSVAPGDNLDLHVNTNPAVPYQVRIYRLGWYGGQGGRLMTCLPSCSAFRPGVVQPAAPPPDPTTGLVDAGWPVTDTVAIPPGWLSGLYVADIVVGDGGGAILHGRMVPFTVRSAPGDHSAVLVMLPVNTWQAYNAWGGKSLYAPSGHAAVKVSFNRPYAVGAIPAYAYPLIRFLERRGYDVSYTTDVDVSAHPGQLQDHKLVIVDGHDEYWTMAMRQGFDNALADGVNLVFMGADIGFWQARLEDGGRTIVEYRRASLDPESNPELKTIPFRDLPTPMPECQLEGVELPYGKFNAGTGSPYVVAPGAAANPWFQGTGLVPGDTVAGAVGYEWDDYVPGCISPAPVAGPAVLFDYSGSPPAAAVTYTAPSGGRVFSAGTLRLIWSLDDWGFPSVPEDVRVQRFASNMLDGLSGLRRSLTVSINTAVGAVTGQTFDTQAVLGGNDGDQFTYAWTVDGVPQPAAGPLLPYAFATSGIHTVSVTVSDDIGLTASATTAVPVAAAPSSPPSPIPAPPSSPSPGPPSPSSPPAGVGTPPGVPGVRAAIRGQLRGPKRLAPGRRAVFHLRLEGSRLRRVSWSLDRRRLRRARGAGLGLAFGSSGAHLLQARVVAATGAEVTAWMRIEVRCRRAGARCAARPRAPSDVTGHPVRRGGRLIAVWWNRALSHQMRRNS